jgi:DNA-binding NtrC family response regulator
MKKQRVLLLIESEENLRERYRKSLVESGEFSVVTLRSLDDTESILRQHHIRVVVTGSMFDDQSTIPLIQKLKAEHRDHIFIIANTRSGEQLNEMKSAGCDAWSSRGKVRSGSLPGFILGKMNLLVAGEN